MKQAGMHGDATGSLRQTDGSGILDQIERILAVPINIVERGITWLLMTPVKPVWKWLDAMSPQFEKTRAARVISYIIYPLAILAALVFGPLIASKGLNSGALLYTAIYFLSLGGIVAVLERLMPWSRNWLHRKDSGTDLTMVLSLFLWKPLLGPLGIFLTAWGVQWIHNEIPEATIRGLWPTMWPAWIQVLLLVILKDLLRYWFHRWMHENTFLWRLHSVHHSSTRLYWFNGVRSHPLESFVQETLWFVPLAFIQAPPEIVFAAGILSLTIGRFQHTNMNARLGIFEYIFSGPMNHRYHHAKDAENGNKNYGGDVILWDHLFGTFHLPKGREPSDDIGVGHMPDFPQNVIGLTLAPFRIRMWREAAARKKAALARGEKL